MVDRPGMKGRKATAHWRTAGLLPRSPRQAIDLKARLIYVIFSGSSRSVAGERCNGFGHFRLPSKKPAREPEAPRNERSGGLLASIPTANVYGDTLHPVYGDTSADGAHRAERGRTARSFAGWGLVSPNLCLTGETFSHHCRSSASLLNVRYDAIQRCRRRHIGERQSGQSTNANRTGHSRAVSRPPPPLRTTVEAIRNRRHLDPRSRGSA